MMRRFFGLPDTSRIRDSSIIKTTIDSSSCISSSHLGTQGSKTSCGNVKGSVLCNVRCKYIDAEDSILIGVTADRIFARPGCIIYNIIDESEDGLDLNHGQVLAGVFSNDGSQLVMRSTTTIDGGKAWKQELEWNPKTFEDIYNMNTNADPLAIEKQSLTAHSSRWKTLTRSSGEGVDPAQVTPLASGEYRKRVSSDAAAPSSRRVGSTTDNSTVATILAARDQELMSASVSPPGSPFDSPFPPPEGLLFLLDWLCSGNTCNSRNSLRGNLGGLCVALLQKAIVVSVRERDAERVRGTTSVMNSIPLLLLTLPIARYQRGNGFWCCLDPRQEDHPPVLRLQNWNKTHTLRRRAAVIGCNS